MVCIYGSIILSRGATLFNLLRTVVLSLRIFIKEFIIYIFKQRKMALLIPMMHPPLLAGSPLYFYSSGSLKLPSAPVSLFPKSFFIFKTPQGSGELIFFFSIQVTRFDKPPQNAFSAN